MRCHQSQGHFRHFITQLRESGQNNQDCQTPYLFRQPILQAAGLSQNPDSQKSEVQKNRNKQGLILSAPNFVLLYFNFFYLETKSEDLSKTNGARDASYLLQLLAQGKRRKKML